MSVGLAVSHDFSVIFFGFLCERVGRWVSRWPTVGLAVVVDLVAAQPDSRDRSLGTQAPPRPARDFTIWATITLTRSNLPQNLFPVGEVMKVLARSPHGRCHPTAEKLQDLLLDNCRRVILRLFRFDQHFGKGFCSRESCCCSVLHYFFLQNFLSPDFF